MKKLIISIFVFIFVASVVFASDLLIKADKQMYNGNENKIRLEGNVKLKMDDVTLESPRAVGNIDPKEQKLTDVAFTDNAYAYKLSKEKKQEIKAQIIKMSLFDKIITAQGNVQSTILEKKEPILIITSEMQDYDTKNDIMSANGGVIVNYKDIKTFSETAKVNITNKGDVKRIELISNAKIEQKDSLVTADKFIYTTANEVAIASGNTFTDAKVDEKTKIKVWADYQQYDKRNNIMIASGSTKIVYNDYTAVGPKATVYPDNKTNKLNKIVFTGRSKINNEGKTIEADKIIMTVNPKNFYAEGNVVTLIPNVNKMNKDDENLF